MLWDVLREIGGDSMYLISVCIQPRQTTSVSRGLFRLITISSRKAHSLRQLISSGRLWKLIIIIMKGVMTADWSTGQGPRCGFTIFNCSRAFCTMCFISCIRRGRLANLFWRGAWGALIRVTCHLCEELANYQWRGWVEIWETFSSCQSSVSERVRPNEDAVELRWQPGTLI